METTIAAVSTPPGTGGIAIIRISGKYAVNIADMVYRGKDSLKNAADRTVNYGFIIDKNGEKIDEALVTIMRAPRSFTAEDVVEISIHGSSVTTREVLSAVISAGAVHAQPGEFTKRAFLNGRIDLSQAEAVIDIINSQNELSRKNALSQLQGRLSDEINKYREKLVALAASMQVIIDYPDEELEDVTPADIKSVSTEILGGIKRLCATKENGRIIQNGIKTAIVGKPNAGKSSLMNMLTGSDRSIVTDIAGTTRDVIEEYISLDGIPLRIMDTAGIHDSSDAVEKIGVEKSRQCIEEADLVIVMLDASRGIEDEDRHILEETKEKKRIILVNKVDLCRNTSALRNEVGLECIEISAKSGEGYDELSSGIKKMYSLGNIESSDMSFITNMRHQTALEKAAEALERVVYAIESGFPTDIASIDLNIAIDSLGEITGAKASEDIVNDIFHRFCVGK